MVDIMISSKMIGNTLESILVFKVFSDRSLKEMKQIIAAFTVFFHKIIRLLCTQHVSKKKYCDGKS